MPANNSVSAVGLYPSAFDWQLWLGFWQKSLILVMLSIPVSPDSAGVR